MENELKTNNETMLNTMNIDAGRVNKLPDKKNDFTNFIADCATEIYRELITDKKKERNKL
ncbi:MAG: hypothetical protein ACTSVI_08935 [Promethearchaeota archaeon]